LTSSGRYASDARRQPCADFAEAQARRGLSDRDFAAQLEAILPHRTIRERHIRCWKRGPTPPPGDVLWWAMQLAGMLEGGRTSSDERRIEGLGSLRPRSLESMAPGAALLEAAAKGLAARVDRDRLTAAHDGLSVLDLRVVEDLATLTRTLGSLNDTVAPRTLLPFARGYYGWLVKLLDVEGPQPLRHEVASIVGQTAMLVGWLLFLAEDRGEARSYWTAAHDLSREFTDELLYAHVLVARSSLSSSLPHGGRDGDSSVTIPLLNAAEARGRTVPIFRAWALSRRAEEHAAAGDAFASERDQADAQHSLAVAIEADVILLGPRTDVDLAGYRGNCAVLLGRDDLAAELLRGAVDAAPRTRATLRAVLLNDLGAALARLNELELACVAFRQSLDLAAETGAAVHVQRVAGAVQRFCACQESGTLSELRERLALLV
ncbi:MAG: hypothetical protein M3256_26585, partial [Actinomycetota bacterium]|nr:hypothetical protein [Actinomycetota bacterium]